MHMELGPSAGCTVSERLAFTAREAAAMLAVSERTLWQLTRDGKVRARKVGRLVMEQQENSHGQHQQ